MSHSPPYPPWRASGLLFENCNCTVICPGHTHFSQNCTHERCVGFWAIRIDEGAWGQVDLTGARALVAYESPQRMIDGGWTQVVVLDAGSAPEQRAAVERILSGRCGGPWEVLARFVGRRLPTRTEAIHLEEEPAMKRVAVEGLMEGVVEPIRGRDRSRPVTFQNMFNQIHAPEQVIARGSTRFDDGTLSFENEGTHGLWSRFSWRVEGPREDGGR
jgi:hypothetical protein